MKDFLEILEDTRTKTQGEENWHFTLPLWSKDKEKNLEQFDLKWEQARPEKSKQQEEALRKTVIKKTPSAKDETLDWPGICRTMLKKYLDLTSNEDLAGGGNKPRLDRVYVPLALVERRIVKESQKLGEQGKEEEKLVQIEEDSFFEEVLRQGRGESQGRRIAIIGEPGSGKTTRLQKLADWILKEDLGLPIWVSLADLEQREITQYLREAWLTEVQEKLSLSAGTLSLEALQAEKQRIWLLLDGVDEMTARIERGHVSQLLDDWTEEVRVVVTCRLNVWEADKNAFSGFEVFRNLPFEPEQVDSFIWIHLSGFIYL